MGSKDVIRQTVITLIWTAVFFAIFLFQFPDDRRYTLFFINKALAQTAVVLIGLSFLLGPVAKVLHFLTHHVHYRKYFGLFGFAFVVFHIITSLLQWQDRFPFKWYVDHVTGVITAIIAVIIFLVLAITSYDPIIHNLGGHRWKAIQRTGYIALVLTLIHIYVVASSRWQQWMDGKVDMPINFLIFIFGMAVIIARILALLVDYLKPSQETSSSLPPTNHSN